MKGGTQPIILMVSLVVVPWLCLASSAALLPALAAAAALKAEYIKVNFSTASATPDKYKSFIASVRAGLVSTAGGSSSSGIPVLISEDDPLALEAFLNVTLVNKAGRSVSLKMDVSGAYFSGYEAGNYSCLLTRPGGALSSQTTVTCYRNSYPWGGPPSVTVDDDDPALAVVPWRVDDLDEAVSSLFLFPTGDATTTREDLSRGLAACDVIIATAATFPSVERRMSARAGGNEGGGVAANDGSMRVLRETWPDLSAAVQESHQGAFAAPVDVLRSNGEWIQVDNVRRAVPLVSFLENAGCKKTTATRAAAAADQRRLPLLIRSVVQEPDEEDMRQLGGGARTTTAVAACGQPEPTVRLVGLAGRCVDVPYGLYFSGTQVQLWSCKSNSDVNQLWTLKRDGTIRSNGKCLAASSSDAAGALVVIDDCPPRVPTARAVWEVRVDGTIALKGSSSSSGGGGGLVLAVTSSILKAGLTVRRDDRGTGQSWTPTNDTAPLDAAIVGFRDLCLQVDNAGAVSVASCGRDGGVPQWSIYADGSIRPPAWLLLQWQCLAADASGRVWVKLCDWAGSACERWVFRNDGTIFNTGTGMVLDVVVTPSSAGATATATASSGQGQVVVSPASANGSPTPTQKWTLML